MPHTVPDAADAPGLSAHPAGHALLVEDTPALHSIPMLAADGHCTGTLTLHWAMPGSWLTDEQQHALGILTAELASWRSWYRRTVVLDALEYLHQHQPDFPNASMTQAEAQSSRIGPADAASTAVGAVSARPGAGGLWTERIW